MIGRLGCISTREARRTRGTLWLGPCDGDDAQTDEDEGDGEAAHDPRGGRALGESRADLRADDGAEREGSGAFETVGVFAAGEVGDGAGE